MTSEGKLIVFEGPDGAGKTTLSHELLNQLGKLGVKATYFSFPGKTPGTLGNLVYQIHHDAGILNARPLPAVSLQLLHLASHIECITSQILPELKRGNWVILDRYWWSLWVYGKVAGIRPKTLTQMIEIEEPYWDRTKATVFLLDRKQKNDLATRELRRVYFELASEFPTVSHVIDNSGSPAESIRKILSALNLPSEETPKGTSLQIPLGLTKSLPQISSLSPAKTTKVYDTYWRFAAERQAIFFRRMVEERGPWTHDAILKEFKFTNAYRASDRVSQYLIRNVIYRGSQAFDEVFFRTMLFKFFNRIETWQLLEKEFQTLTFAEFSIKAYDRVLSAAMSKGSRIYSAAYIMPTGGQRRPKHQMHLDLLLKMMTDELPAKIANAKTMGNAFDLLLEYPTIGNFLAYQFITDLNYSANLTFSEMEFTMPGPGALGGIHKCFSDLGGLTESEIIKLVAERQQFEFERLGIDFKSLWGRPLQLIDCQNLFCEVDKYSRVAHPEFTKEKGRARIKQKFSPEHKRVDYWFPPKWGLNKKIANGVQHVQNV